MIKTKADLKEYMERDRIMLGETRRHPRPFTDEIWKYEILLRRNEYWYNQNSFFAKLMYTCYKIKLHRMSVKLGIFIGLNTCGKGLSIAHINCIEINENARIGENLRIHEGVTIGASGGTDAPQIGDCVFLASGCKVMGKISIASHCVVGANAVVVKDINEEGITVGGVPAKKISDHNSDRFVFRNPSMLALKK